MTEYLRHWRWLVCVLVGTALGVFFTAGCSERSRRCLSITTTDDVVVAAIVGALIGLAFAVLIVIASVAADRRAAILAARFPDALLVMCRADSLTARAAAGLGADVLAGRPMVLVVDHRGIQLWESEAAETMLLGLPWSRLGPAAIGDPHGDPTSMRSSISSRYSPAYDRLLLPVDDGEEATSLQLPVLATNPDQRGSRFADAYDLRMLSRKINGYKSVHDRERDASAGDSADTPR